MTRWSDRTKAGVLFALPLLIYGFGVGRAFVFDDLVYISENPLLRREDALRLFWSGAETFNYYPLFWSLLRVQWLLWGDHALGYHLVNLLVHCVNALLVWRIARSLELPGAWWVGAIFAVHPIHVQTLAWAAEQKNTWSFLFMAISVLVFLQHARRRDWLSYGIALLCFLAALACKTSVVSLPIFLGVCWLGLGGFSGRALILRLGPFFAASLAAGVTTMWFEQHRVIAKSLMSTLSLWERLEAAGATFWFYLWKALVPIGLTPFYRGWVDTTAAGSTAIPGVLLLALLVVCAIGWRRIGGAVAVGVIYYAVMLLPLLGVFDTNFFVYSLVADHWQYHALPGVIVAAVAAASRLSSAWPGVARWRDAGGTLVIISLALLASVHFAHFEDARSLWTHVVGRNPDAWLGWYNLGTVYSDEGEHGNAVALYQRSIAIKPDHYRARFNLANALAASGRLQEADQAYLDAQRMQPDDPAGFVNHAVLLLRMGNEEAARGAFQRALALDSEQPSALVNLVVINVRSGRLEEAARYLQPAAFMNPENGRRVAEAIGTAREQDIASRETLELFARRACEVSRDHPDLRSVLTSLQRRQ